MNATYNASLIITKTSEIKIKTKSFPIGLSLNASYAIGHCGLNMFISPEFDYIHQYEGGFTFKVSIPVGETVTVSWTYSDQ